MTLIAESISTLYLCSRCGRWLLDRLYLLPGGTAKVTQECPVHGRVL